MLDLETRITEARRSIGKLYKALLQEAVSEYIKTLIAGDPTSSAGHDTAVVRTRTILKQRIFGSDWFSAITSGKTLDEASRHSLALRFESVLTPLQISRPVPSTGPKPLGTALAGLLGAAGGMLICTPVARIALDMRDLGLALGGPLGAFILVWLYWKGSRWHLLGWLTGTSKGRRIDLNGQRRIAHDAVTQWLDAAIGLQVMLVEAPSLWLQSDSEKDEVLRKLSRKIYALHHADEPSLNVTADELIQEARNLGFEGLDGSPVFLSSAAQICDTIEWKNSLSDQYEVFGHVQDGDQVQVERKPVVLDGKVMERGLVRKVRK